MTAPMTAVRSLLDCQRQACSGELALSCSAFMFTHLPLIHRLCHTMCFEGRELSTISARLPPAEMTFWGI